MKTNSISYKLVENKTPTADKAPYTAMAIPAGSLAYDNIFAAMEESGARITRATAKYFLDAFFEFCAETIADQVVRVSTGTVAVYPMIGGSFGSEDAAYDAAKNSLYIGATLSQSVQDRLEGVVPDHTGEEIPGSVKLDSEMDIESQSFKTIDGRKPFRIAGRNLTVPDGADEYIALYSKDGKTKVADVEVTENDGGQRITCCLTQDHTVLKGSYQLRIASHGIDPTAPLVTLTLGVKLVSDVYRPDAG